MAGARGMRKVILRHCHTGAWATLGCALKEAKFKARYRKSKAQGDKGAYYSVGPTPLLPALVLLLLLPPSMATFLATALAKLAVIAGIE